jgi:hypothetical protein
VNQTPSQACDNVKKKAKDTAKGAADLFDKAEDCGYNNDKAACG